MIKRCLKCGRLIWPWSRGSYQIPWTGGSSRWMHYGCAYGRRA